MAETDFALATLRGMIANLQDHIDKRAAEIAAPRIRTAELAAQEHVAQAERELALERQWWSDLETELRRQITALERQVQKREPARA